MEGLVEDPATSSTLTSLWRRGRPELGPVVPDKERFAGLLWDRCDRGNQLPWPRAPRPGFSIVQRTNESEMKETSLTTVLSGKCKEFLEARVGIEPTHKGFADLSLTTWVPRLEDGRCEKPSRTGEGDKFWSGRRDLNPRLRPWQGRTLPLSYSRSPSWIIAKA